MKSDKIQFEWDICGHEKNIDFLQMSVKNDNLAHAYLFVGPSGLGKSTIADEFISSIFCQSKDGTVPCGECVHCQQLQNGTHADVYFLSRETDEKTGKLKKNISVEQIRNLKQKLQQGTLLSSYKAAIISQAEFINISGANALLKILEEPSSQKTVMILITNDIDKIPQTIISRCQVLRFLPVATEKIKSYLSTLDTAVDLDTIARLAYGRPGRAISLLDHPEAVDRCKEDINLFFQLLAIDPGRRLSLLDDSLQWKKDEALNIVRVEEIFSHWLGILRDILLSGSQAGQLVANMDFSQALDKNGQNFSFSRIKKIADTIVKSRYYFSHNVNSRSVLENLVINI